ARACLNLRSGTGRYDQDTAMITARKRWQAGGMTAAGLAGLWLAAPALAARGPDLTLRASAFVVRRFGIGAVWPRWSIGGAAADGRRQAVGAGRRALGDAPPTPAARRSADS